MKNALKELLVITFGLVYLLASAIALGQAGNPVQVAGNRDVSLPPGLVTIYSNLQPPPNRYDDTKGYYVAGPLSPPKQHWLAMPFTPAADSHVTKIKVAIQWIANVNDVTIKIASGATLPTAFVPGSLKTLSGLPTFTGSTCCPTPTVNYGGAGIALTGGTQYWVVAVTNSSSTSTEDLWCLVWNDLIGTFAYNHGHGWVLVKDQKPALAFAVLGTTP